MINIIELSQRLKRICEYVKSECVADIGTDHAYIPIYLTQNKICSFVIATDIAKKPAQIAAANVEKYSVPVEVRVGAGLDCIHEGEVSEIIIAGMGGLMIIKILENHLDFAKKCRLILQPMNNQYELRKFLVENDFNTVTEDLTVEDYHVYNIIVIDAGKQKNILYRKELDFHIPSCLHKNKNIKLLCEKKIREFTKKCEGLSKSSKDSSLYDESQKLLTQMKGFYSINCN